MSTNVLPSITVVVGGGRYFEKEDIAFAALDHIDQNIGHIARVAHGGCRGADALADRWARERGREIQIYWADWDTFGRRAGPIRNGRMLRSERPDIVVTLPGGTGTKNLIEQAEMLGRRIIKVEGA